MTGPDPASSRAAIAQSRIWDAICGPWRYCALLAFTQHGCADLLDDGPTTTEELAASCQADPDALGRLLRCCASFGLVTPDPAGQWTLTVAGTALREDGGTMRAAVLANAGPPAWGAMLHLAAAVRTGKPVFDSIAGQDFYDWHAAEPAHGEIFQQFMTSRSGLAAETIAGLDFSDAAVVADIGGGYGTILAAVLAAHEHLHGILLDRPGVLPGARDYLAGRGLDGRCDLTAGDYLDPGDIPAADVYLLGSILHNHDDDQAGRILASANSGGRVICAEILLPGHPAVPHTGTDLDMRRLAIGGRERTEDEYTALLTATGLTVTSITATASALSVIDSRHARGTGLTP